MNNTNTANPSGAGIVWQPVSIAPAKIAYNITGIKLTSILVFSIVSIILGILSIGLQIPALVIYATSIYNYVFDPFDVVGHGIWCGCFYVTAGSLGVAACNKRTKSLFVGTVVLSALSIACSIVATTLSAIAASSGVSYRCYSDGYYYYNLCDAWLGLEWTLMTVSLLAFISSVTLVALASVPLCCGKRNQGSDRTTKVTVGLGNHQQPMYFQPQPMYVAAQQQQQPNVHYAYTGQQTQYPQQVLYPQLQEPQFLQPTSNFQAVNAPQQSHQPQLPQQPPMVHQQYPQFPQQAPFVDEEK